MGLVEPPIHKQVRLEMLQMSKPNRLGKRKRFRSKCMTSKWRVKSRFAKLALLVKIG
jgi:hypothetical protein